MGCSASGAAPDAAVFAAVTNGERSLTYPMWVLPMSVLMAMEGPPKPHHELIKANLLVRYRPGMLVTFWPELGTDWDLPGYRGYQALKPQGGCRPGFGIPPTVLGFPGELRFISHQWLGQRHPDPDGRQVGVFQAFFKNLVAGKVMLGSDVDLLSIMGPTFAFSSQRALSSQGFVWFDWFSVPQTVGEFEGCEKTRAAQQRAINSIPSYVSESMCFVVLCPSVPNHVGTVCDFNTWKARGWCRAEQMCHFLSSSDATVIIVKSPTTVSFSSTCFNTLACPVGQGNFAVDSDKGPVGAAIRTAIQIALRQPILKELPLTTALADCCLGLSTTSP